MTMINTKKGFTITEILIVAAISSLILAALYEISILGRRTWLTGEALVSAQENARLGVERIANELRHSNHIHVFVGADNKTVRFDVPLDSDEDGFLDLITGTSSIVFGAEDNADWEIEYVIVDNVDDTDQILRRVYDGGGNKVSETVIARYIDADNSSFQTESGETGMPQESVIITVSTEVADVQGMPLASPIQTTLETTVNLRN